VGEIIGEVSTLMRGFRLQKTHSGEIRTLHNDGFGDLGEREVMSSPKFYGCERNSRRLAGAEPLSEQAEALFTKNTQLADEKKGHRR
jgi:hypothetical protein